MPFTELNLSDLPILNDTNSSTSFDPPSKDFYLGLFQFKLSKIMSILSACTILPFDIALFYGIIWYERFGTDNRRTLMNKLLTSLSWTIIACLLLPLFDVVRYMSPPFPVNVCFVHLLLKITTKNMVLLYLDAILITKYVLVFWLKNPLAVNDEFWCLFISSWITGASCLSDFVRYFLPGRQSFSYYICAGIDSTPDHKLPPKSTSFIEMLSVALYVAIQARIYIHRKQRKVDPVLNSTNKLFNISKIEKQTIADASSNFFIVACFASYFFVLIKLRDVNPIDFNLYPNYLYIYFHQLLWSGLMAATIAIVYYVRHPPLRKTLFKEFKSFIGMTTPIE